MNRKTLREIAKFSAGVIACDFIVILWLTLSEIPVDFLGRELSSDILISSLLFDAGLFIFLVHYGWHINKIPAIRERTYFLLGGAIFAIVCIAHVLRIFVSVDLQIAGVVIPVWASWIGIAISGYFSYMSLHFALSKKKK